MSAQNLVRSIALDALRPDVPASDASCWIDGAHGNIFDAFDEQAEEGHVGAWVLLGGSVSTGVTHIRSRGLLRVNLSIRDHTLAACALMGVSFRTSPHSLPETSSAVIRVTFVHESVGPEGEGGGEERREMEQSLTVR